MKIFEVSLLTLIVLMVTDVAHAFQDCELTPEQESILHFSYSYGEPHSVGYTLAAIAMQESDLGRYLINISDPSGGVWHLTVDKAVNKLGWEHTPFNYNRAIQLLVDDIHFAADIALDTVLWWHNYHDGDWFKTWSGYNGGFKGNPKYAHQIAENIKTIKECKWLKSSVYGQE